jgi:hypothetical protein
MMSFSLGTHDPLLRFTKVLLVLSNSVKRKQPVMSSDSSARWRLRPRAATAKWLLASRSTRNGNSLRTAACHAQQAA